MSAQRLPSRFMRKALPVLLLSVSCALYACTGKGDAPAPAPTDPDWEHLQG
jgi:outer membrane biogenesis lipoprotein LolB